MAGKTISEDDLFLMPLGDFRCVHGMRFARHVRLKCSALPKVSPKSRTFILGNHIRTPTRDTIHPHPHANNNQTKQQTHNN